MSKFLKKSVDLQVNGQPVTVSSIYRMGSKMPIVFLHGFGSTKEDYADLVLFEQFKDRAFLAYDAPGCGESWIGDLSLVSIEFLVKVAEGMLAHFGIDKFHLVGHSMGGLTALMLTQALPGRIVSFTDIEGNIAPEDCFLSRQIVDFPADDPDVFFNEFIERTRFAPAYSSSLYAASLIHKVRAGAVRSIFESMVRLSDSGLLMDRFTQLPVPKMFMYGEQNDSLSYLEYIESKGVRRARIPHCGHFPMYSNPVAMWEEIHSFIENAEHP